MKKVVIILLVMLMMVSTVEAKKVEKLRNRNSVNYYSYNNAVNFFENGIEFFVFTNGDFDYDTSFNNRRVRIERNFKEQIRRIGNVSFKYDLNGNVTRIGNIRINYYRNRLTNVGNLRVNYDRRGNPIFYGNVRDYYYDNGIRFNISFGNVCNYNDSFFFNNNFRRNYSQIREDRNFYYYRAKPNAKIGKRSTIIKRRKPNNSSLNSNNRNPKKYKNIYREKPSNRTTIKSNRKIRKLSHSRTKKNIKSSKRSNKRIKS